MSTEDWKERFDAELIPVDYLTSMAGDGIIADDRGVAVAVASYHTARIKLFIEAELTRKEKETKEWCAGVLEKLPPIVIDCVCKNKCLVHAMSIDKSAAIAAITSQESK